MKQNKNDVLLAFRLPDRSSFLLDYLKNFFVRFFCMYPSKTCVMFLGAKKQSFQDSEMFKVDFYIEGEVDSFFIQSNNPLISDIQKLKPTSMVTIEVTWQKTRDGWKHRLSRVSTGV